ncbi:MAG: acyltransferase [Clostridia bacterium]|nr:acyltransferase [Clostridia bacterium]
MLQYFAHMETTNYRKPHIPALDGLRAAAVLIICWYHIWQQSWLAPYLHIGGKTLSFDAVPRTGYLFVDLMLLLSAFLLFLPHAESMVYGTPAPAVGPFYKKRAARIVPSYYLAALTMFSVSLIAGKYGSFGEAFRDIGATLTFTQTLSAQTYIGTKVNGVLWTAAIEVAFYLMFPLLAKAFRKKPCLTWAGMTAIGLLYMEFMVIRREDILRVSLNQLPAFAGVFANGMMASYLYVLADKKLNRRRPWWVLAASTALFVASVLAIRAGMNVAASTRTLQLTQAKLRYPMALFFTTLVFSMSLGGKPFELIFGNRLMRFFAGISYNLYLWHQWLAVHLKEMRIPFWTGEKPPNMTGNILWQRQYTALCFFVAIAVAVLLTYCFERPVARALLKKRTSKEND